MKPRQTLPLTTLLLALASVPALAGWMDTPDALALEPVGLTLAVNGTPMQVRSFVSTLPMGALLDQVQATWNGGGSGINERSVVQRDVTSSWNVLNQHIGQQHRSFQVRDMGGGRLEGFVALTSPQQARAARLQVPLPAGMTVVSVIDSSDTGHHAQQVIAVSTRAMAGSANALESALAARGWQRHARQQQGDGLMLSANKGPQEFDAILHSERQGTLLMMNTVTPD